MELTLFDQISAMGAIEDVRLAVIEKLNRPKLHRNTVRDALKAELANPKGLRKCIYIEAQRIAAEKRGRQDTTPDAQKKPGQ